MTGSIEDAADLTQQAFCKAFESWGRFDGKSLPTTWLHAILLNCVRDWARRKAGRRDDPPDPWETAVVDKGQNGAEELAKKETLDHLRQEIEQLPLPPRAYKHLRLSPNENQQRFAFTKFEEELHQSLERFR